MQVHDLANGAEGRETVSNLRRCISLGVVCLSCVPGNWQAQFLGGDGAVLHRPYPTTSVPKLINAYIRGTLVAVFRNPTFLIHTEEACEGVGCRSRKFSETQLPLPDFIEDAPMWSRR